jgi:hypothetical protein
MMMMIATRMPRLRHPVSPTNLVVLYQTRMNRFPRQHDYNMRYQGSRRVVKKNIPESKITCNGAYEFDERLEAVTFVIGAPIQL